MILEMNKVVKQLDDLYAAQREALSKHSTAELKDLQHLCEENRNVKSWLARTAAEINNTAAELIIEERKNGKETRS